MEYRFSLTPRLIALALFAGVALLVLLFTLGYQVGQRAAETPPVPPAFTTYSEGAEKRIEQRAENKALGVARNAARPVSDGARSVQKALP